MTELYYGPLNKSLFTQELELITKCILRKSDKVKVEYSNSGNDLHATVGTIDVNLSQLLKRAHFSHIQLEKSDSDLFVKNSNSHSNYDFTSQKYKSLTQGETQAIKAYSGMEYYKINSMLYGTSVSYSNPKDVFLKTMMLASGLNKITDVAAHTPTYRGEHVPKHEISERIDIIKHGGGITDSKAFLSTSSDSYVANNFKTSSLIHFDSAYGKDISGLSHFPSEKEFLLPPTQILWEGHKVVNGTHIFQAKVVEPLIEGKDDHSNQDMNIFNKLVNWAHHEGIDTSFITPFLQNELDNHNKREVQSLDHRNENETLEAIKPQTLVEISPLSIKDCLSFEKNDSISGLETVNSDLGTSSSNTPVMERISHNESVVTAELEQSACIATLNNQHDMIPVVNVEMVV